LGFNGFVDGGCELPIKKGGTQTMTEQKNLCKISVGNIPVEAPTVEQAQQLFQVACGVRQHNPINEAIR
jgi:hypothetical protein